MKNKLHTMLRQAQQPQAQQPNQQLTVTELRSLSLSKCRSAASHPICHSVGVSRCKESNAIFYVLFSILYFLFSLPATAQPYQWQWAVNGGGSLGESGWYYQVEQVFDVQIGTDNNYYFVAKIKNGTPQLGGQPVTVYGNQMGGNDIFIFSTTCNGQVCWSQAIGGGGAV